MQPSVSNIMIISDEAVAPLHLQTVVDALQIDQKSIFIRCTEW